MAVMQFGILGPLEVRADGRSVPLGGAKPRAALALLALHANQAVSAERVAVALWGEDAPPSAVKYTRRSTRTPASHGSSPVIRSEHARPSAKRWR
jgi:DNA-binding SARP family transcriptional activator